MCDSRGMTFTHLVLKAYGHPSGRPLFCECQKVSMKLLTGIKGVRSPVKKIVLIDG
jgi:hypothetical protein